jgi:hypothetical protein
MRASELVTNLTPFHVWLAIAGRDHSADRVTRRAHQSGLHRDVGDFRGGDGLLAANLLMGETTQRPVNTGGADHISYRYLVVAS